LDDQLFHSLINTLINQSVIYLFSQIYWHNLPARCSVILKKGSHFSKTIISFEKGESNFTEECDRPMTIDISFSLG
jgi:hypothetical protein